MDILKETVDAVVNSRFPEMSKEGRQQLAEVLIHKNVNKGEIILNEGQIAHDLIFVGKGMVRQFYYKNGNIVVSADACASAVNGTVVYLKVVFDDSNATTTTIALTVND